MYDAFGKEYLDFAAGIAVNALGRFQLSFPFLREVYVQTIPTGICELTYAIKA